MGTKFKRANAKQYKRVKQTWRTPRGIDNKQRIRVRSRPKVPRIGHGTNAETRNQHPTGVFEALVANARELEAVSEGTAVRFTSGIGVLKKKALVAKAKEKGFKVLNE